MHVMQTQRRAECEVPMTILTKMVQICERVNHLSGGLVLPLFYILVLHWLAADVLATHFRGGIIMVRPVDGGAPVEVNYQYRN